MKKLGLLVMPLMVVSLLVSCNNGGGDKPGPDTFTVTFDANGGTLSGESSIKVNSGTLFKDITNKPTASKTPVDAYTFNGWALVDDSQKCISDDYKITNDLTVYAIYTPKAYATVTFSEESSECTLSYNDNVLTKGAPCKIPAEVDVTLKIESNQGYFPILDGDVEIHEAQSYSFNLVEKEMTIKVAKDNACVIKATAENTPRGSLESYKWSEINILSKAGLADECFDVGNTKTVRLNKQYFDHDVRIIGFNKDIDPDGNNLGITFEFADLISDANGYSLASLWQNAATVEGSSYNYLDSTIRKNLTGNGGGSIMWYEKGSGVISDNYKTSVYDMLPDELKEEGILKTTRKKVNLHTTGSWVETDVDDKLFLLSPNEMNEQVDDAEAGEAYEYYKDATPHAVNPIRIKQQIKGSDGATTPTSITESAYGSGLSYAGYNSSTEEEGGISWLRSPNKDTSNGSYRVGVDGYLNNSSAYYSALAVAPAFCI